MKLGKFKDLAEKRFGKEEIAEMNREVALEAEVLKALQQRDIKSDKKMNKLFEGLKAGLGEAIAHRDGKIHLHTESIEIPGRVKNIKAKTSRKRRT